MNPITFWRLDLKAQPCAGLLPTFLGPRGPLVLPLIDPYIQCKKNLDHLHTGIHTWYFLWFLNYPHMWYFYVSFFKLSSHVGAQLRRITAPCTVAAGKAENSNKFCNFEFWRILFSHLKNQYLAMSLFRRKLPTVEETYLWEKWKRKVPWICKICWKVAHLVEISSPFLIGTRDLSSKLKSGSFW